ncbi:hypothetical protein ACEZDB_22585 [Streptacidiphilus sp. N1-3]|uniref:Uncharacterized protein n=1 Tax=Streptacidiphilus alkalitolerans TaxID=3342712 RepID=A0ABV6X5Y1_9ACTN
MPFEDELTDALRSTAGSFHTDPTKLVNAGITDGRRRRRRRTVGVVGSVTALALVGVGGTFASGVLDAGARPVGAAAGPATPTHLPSSLTRPGATTSGGAVPVFSAQQMRTAFESMLPKGHFSAVQAEGITSRQKGDSTFVDGPSASLVLNDGKGPSAVSISIRRLATTVNDQMVQQYIACPSHTVRPDISCSRKTLPNGTVLTVMQGLENPNYGSKEKDWTAYLATANGSLITLDETNSAQEKGAVSRPEPVLSVKQLKAVVTNPFWVTITSELPAPPPPPVQTGPTHNSLSADRIGATLRAALPKGLTLSMDSDNQDGYASGRINDGHGAGAIGINADWFGTSGDAVDQVFGGATVLADGTRIVVDQGASEKGGAGAVQWTVQVLHKDGRRIVVSELNASAFNTAKDRPEPVLTLAQLKALALSPSWVSTAW